MADVIIKLLAKDSASASIKVLARELGLFGNATEKAHGKLFALGIAIGGFTAVGGVMIKAVMHTVKLGEALRDMSLSTGVAVESLSTLRYAADQANVTLDQVGLGLKMLARNAVEATKKGSQQARAFREMGVAVRNVAGEMRPVLAIMYDLSDRFRVMTDETKRAALAQKMFGRAGTELLPFLLEDVRALQQNAQDLGLQMTTAQAQAADDLGDAWGKLRFVAGGLAQDIGVAVIPSLTELLNIFNDLSQRTGQGAWKWSSETMQITSALFKKLYVSGKAAFGALWENVTALWKLYVQRPLLAMWGGLLIAFGGVLGKFGLNVEENLAGVRRELEELGKVDLVDITDAMTKAAAEIPWPDFTADVKEATAAVTAFKEEFAPVPEPVDQAPGAGARFMGLPHAREWQAKIDQDQIYLNQMVGIYQTTWNRMVTQHYSLWRRFAAGVAVGVTDYKESLGTFTASVATTVTRALGDMEAGLSGGLRTLFFGREDEKALERGRKILQREARQFKGLQLDVFGEQPGQTQADISRINDVFSRALEGLGTSMRGKVEDVRAAFLGLSDIAATPEDARAAGQALEALIDKMGAQLGFLGRVRSFGEQMKETIVTGFETGLTNLLAASIMRGLVGLGEDLLLKNKEEVVGGGVAGGVHGGMEKAWRDTLSFDFIGNRLDSVKSNPKIASLGTSMAGGVRTAMSIAWAGSSFQFIADKLGLVADTLPTGAGSVGAKLGEGIKAGLVVWATGKTFEQLTGINLPDPIINGLAVAEGVLSMFGSNIAAEVSAIFGKDDPKSILGRIEGNLGGAVRGAFLGAGIGAMFGPTGAIGGAIGGGLAGALTTALGIAGPVGLAITAIGSFMASTIFASFAASRTAEKRYAGITGEAVEAFKAGGIGRLQSATLAKQQEGYRRGGREGQQSAERDLARQIREQLPGLNVGESTVMARMLLTGNYYGAQGVMLNDLIRRELTRQAAEEQRKGQTMADIFSAAQAGPAPSGPLLGAQHGLLRVPGPSSAPVPAILHGGEMVLPARQAEQVRVGGGASINVTFNLSSASDREMVAMLREQLPMIERAVTDGIRKGARFGAMEFDQRMIRTVLQS